MFAPPNWKGRARHSGRRCVRPPTFLVVAPQLGRFRWQDRHLTRAAVGGRYFFKGSQPLVDGRTGRPQLTRCPLGTSAPGTAAATVSPRWYP